MAECGEAIAAGLQPEAVRAVRRRLEPWIIETPSIRWPADTEDLIGDGELYIKLELLQRTGSFKPRGALNVLLQAEDLSAGVTAFSAGNHAIATAYAGRCLGASVKVVMPRSANAFRVARCRALGAEIEFGESIDDLLSRVERLCAEEGRLLVHPFEGLSTIQGTATVGLELMDQLDTLDAVIVPVGGGGLIAGIASIVKARCPGCEVIGVEPIGASGMRQSVEHGRPMSTVTVKTIADSLGAPMHAPVSFELVRTHVDRLVEVSDEEMVQAMRRCFEELKLAVEPAGAAALAALHCRRRLRESLAGRRVALIGCGTNIDLATWSGLISEHD